MATFTRWALQRKKGIQGEQTKVNRFDVYDHMNPNLVKSVEIASSETIVSK